MDVDIQSETVYSLAGGFGWTGRTRGTRRARRAGFSLQLELLERPSHPTARYRGRGDQKAQEENSEEQAENILRHDGVKKYEGLNKRG